MEQGFEILYGAVAIVLVIWFLTFHLQTERENQKIQRVVEHQLEEDRSLIHHKGV